MYISMSQNKHDDFGRIVSLQLMQNNLLEHANKLKCIYMSLRTK